MSGACLSFLTHILVICNYLASDQTGSGRRTGHIRTSTATSGLLAKSNESYELPSSTCAYVVERSGASAVIARETR